MADRADMQPHQRRREHARSRRQVPFDPVEPGCPRAETREAGQFAIALDGALEIERRPETHRVDQVICLDGGAPPRRGPRIDAPPCLRARNSSPTSSNAWT